VYLTSVKASDLQLSLLLLLLLLSLAGLFLYLRVPKGLADLAGSTQVTSSIDSIGSNTIRAVVPHQRVTLVLVPAK